MVHFDFGDLHSILERNRDLKSAMLLSGLNVYDVTQSVSRCMDIISSFELDTSSRCYPFEDDIFRRVMSQHFNLCVSRLVLRIACQKLNVKILKINGIVFKLPAPKNPEIQDLFLKFYQSECGEGHAEKR